MKAWVLSHHADVDWLLKSAPVGTSDVHWRDAGSEPAPESTSVATGQDTSWDWLRRETLTFKEGSEHARLRRYVSRTFTPAAVRRLAPRLRELVSTELDEAARGGDDFDLARDLSSRAPIQILGWLVGVPSEMEADFCRYAVQLQNVINPLADEAARREADAAANGFQKMIDEIIGRAEMHPGEELLSALVHHDDGEGRLDRTSLLGIITAIIMAGAETTGSLVNHGMLALLRHPDQLARLRAEPELLPTAIEELGRFEFPGGRRDHGGLVKVRLAEIAFARSGDKGDTANIGLIAFRPSIYPILVQEVTSCSSSSCFRRASVTPWAMLPQPERPIAQTINAIAATLLLMSFSLCPKFPLLH